MAKAERDLKIHLTLTESEACDLYIHLHPEYKPNKCGDIKASIKSALGYEPTEAPSCV